MKVSINREDFKITEYDDEESILMRYAASKNAIPSNFFMTKTKEKAYSVISVTDELMGMGIQDFEEKGKLTKLSIMFPNMTQEDFVYEWINNFEHGVKSDQDIIHFKRMNRYLFPSYDTVKRNYETYIGNLTDKVKENKQKLKKRIKLFNVLSETEYNANVNISNFKVESKVLSLAVTLPDGDELYEIFNKMMVSPFIPFVVLVSGARTYTKVYSHIVPFTSWVNVPRLQDGVYFYMLHTIEDGIESKITRIMEGLGNYGGEERVISERYFSKGVWTPENRIELDLVTTSDPKEKDVETLLLERFFSAFDGLNYQIIAQNYSRIRGSADITGVNIYMVAFADMITNNDLFRDFLYLSETTKTITEKTSPSMFFSWVPPEDKNRNTSVIVNINTTVNLSVHTKFNRAKTELGARVLLKVLRTLFGLYDGTIVREYRPNKVLEF